jgi:hypothetical protein
MAVRDDFTAGEVLAAADLNDTFAAKLDLAGGKVLQIVRATDATNRATTSTTFVDVTGMSVTITPQRDTSAIIILVSFLGRLTVSPAGTCVGAYQITDSSNNALSGATTGFGSISVTDTRSPLTLLGYATPATTSPVTYKLRFNATTPATNTVTNATQTGQLYAIEVSA